MDNVTRIKKFERIDLSGRTEQVREEILWLLDKNINTKIVRRWELEKIDYLHLDKKGIKKLKKDDFYGLSGLICLNLSQNQLVKLEKGLFKYLDNLVSLYLDSNGLKSLETGVFEGLTKLKRLFLHLNYLEELELKVFRNLSNLETLHLQGNKLRAFPKRIFKGLDELWGLRLDHNYLEKFFRENLSIKMLSDFNEAVRIDDGCEVRRVDEIRKSLISLVK